MGRQHVIIAEHVTMTLRQTAWWTARGYGEAHRLWINAESVLVMTVASTAEESRLAMRLLRIAPRSRLVRQGQARTPSFLASADTAMSLLAAMPREQATFVACSTFLQCVSLFPAQG